jgi:hypothetical protein
VLQLSQTEIEYLQTTIRRDAKIRRFQVAVQDHLTVRGRKHVRELEARQTAIGVELASVRPLPGGPGRRSGPAGGVAALLRHSTAQSRAVLQGVLHGRIAFTPTHDGYTFAAPTRTA